MRVTAERKAETRRDLLAAAQRLFGQRGYAETTTREIALTAGVAAGTLFNYFPTKEALAMTLIHDAADSVTAESERTRRGNESIDELLFAETVITLRRLTTYRPFVGAVLEVSFGAATDEATRISAESFRRDREEAMERVVVAARPELLEKLGFVTRHLYWTLLGGIYSFWATDESPNQEDTLVVLDESMRLFAASITGSTEQTKDDHNVSEHS